MSQPPAPGVGKLELKHCLLTCSTFEEVCLGKAQFHDVNLGEAKLDDVNLGHASFRNINLSHSTFENINFSFAEITHANLEGMKINGILVTELLAAYQAAQ